MNTENNNKSKYHAFYAFNFLSSSLIYSILKLDEARIVANTIQIALISTNIIHKDNEKVIYSSKLIGLNDVTSRQLDNFLNVKNSSFLIYATAIFDSYLSDVMKFLIFLNPGPYKKELSFTFEECDGLSSINEIKKKMIDRKVRLISHKSFNDRFKEFKRAYGLKIDITNKELAQLNKTSSIRNTITHNNSFLDLAYDAEGLVSPIENKTFNTEITNELLGEAINNYFVICKKLYSAVCKQVIVDYKEDEFNSFMDIMKSEKAN